MMEQHILNEGKQVVKRFKTMLTEQQIEALGDELFDELETLVTASVGSNVSAEAHKAAKMIESVAHELRKEASF